MTTSGTSSYNATIIEIIEEAYGLIRVGADEEPLTDSLAQDARKSLNMMLKAWDADGLHLWCKTEGVLFLVNGQASYALGGTNTDNSALASAVATTSLTADALSGATSISVDSITGIASADNIGIELADGSLQWTTVNGAPSGSTVTLTDALTDDVETGGAVFAYTTKLTRPTRILQARRRIFNPTVSSVIDIPITLMERPDYFDQPTKLQAATETMLYYDPQLVTGQMYIWSPASDETDTVRFTFERPLQDVSTLTETIDLPQEWLEAIAWNLAYRLSYKTSFPIVERQQLKIDALAMKEKLEGFDREYSSVNFQPDFTSGGGYSPYGDD